jgi:hypothetical protein
MDLADIPVNAMTAHAETVGSLRHVVSLGGPLENSKFFGRQLGAGATARADDALLLNLCSRHLASFRVAAEAADSVNSSTPAVAPHTSPVDKEVKCEGEA